MTYFSIVQMMELHTRIVNITITFEGKRLYWEDLCFRWLLLRNTFRIFLIYRNQSHSNFKIYRAFTDICYICHSLALRAFKTWLTYACGMSVLSLSTMFTFFSELFGWIANDNSSSTYWISLIWYESGQKYLFTQYFSSLNNFPPSFTGVRRKRTAFDKLSTSLFTCVCRNVVAKNRTTHVVKPLHQRLPMTHWHNRGHDDVMVKVVNVQI